MVERDCYWGEDGSRRDRLAFGVPLHPLRLGSAPGFPAHCLCSPLPLQQLWLAWRVFKLIQLSGGLFLVQSALDLAAAQRALLSCCPGCRWFGEARASPWLCPRSHPLLQPAHRTIPAPVPSLQDYFYPTFYVQLSESTLESTSWLSQDPGKPAGSSCLPLSSLSDQGSQKEQWMSVQGEEGWSAPR